MLGFVLAAIGGGVVVFAGYYANHYRERIALLDRVTQTSLDDVASAGPVFLEGEITEPDGDVGPVLTDGVDEPVLAAWSVHQCEYATNYKRPIISGIDSVPFQLACPTGRIEIDPPDSTPVFLLPSRLLSVRLEGLAVDGVVGEFGTFPRLDKDVHGVPDSSSEAFLAHNPRVQDRIEQGAFLPRSRQFRFYERTFEPGDTVGVLGYVQAKRGVEDPSGLDDLVVGPSRRGDPFIVTTKSRAALRESSKRRLRGGLVCLSLGLLLVVAGVTLFGF